MDGVPCYLKPSFSKHHQPSPTQLTACLRKIIFLVPCQLDLSTHAWRLQSLEDTGWPSAHVPSCLEPMQSTGADELSQQPSVGKDLPLMWVRGSEPTADGQPTQSVNMQQTPLSWASRLLFPALPCCWKRARARLGTILEPLTFTMDTQMKPGWACLSWRWLWTGLWSSAEINLLTTNAFSQLQLSFSEPDALWSPQTRLSAALHAEMTSLTMPFLLLLQVAHFTQTDVLTSSVWTGKITSASQWPFHFPQ